VVNKELQQRQEAREPAPAQERIYEEREEQSMTIGNSIGRRAWPGSQLLRCCWRPTVTRAHGTQGNSQAICDSLQVPQEAQDKERRSANASQEAKREKTKSASGNQERGKRVQEKLERCKELYDNDVKDPGRRPLRPGGGKIQELADMNGAQNGWRRVLEALRGEQTGKRDAALTTIRT